MSRIRLTIACAALILSACPGRSSGPPTRKEWADTFVVQSEELKGWVDVEYRFAHSDPAYEVGRGPRVCVDEWHFNRHTVGGIYWPFAELLRGDGYRVEPLRSLITSEALKDCDIFVIANPQARSNMFGPGTPESNWAYPHASALTAEEVTEVVMWTQSGGALFLISDHAPLAAAVSDLGLLLGVHMLDGYTFASSGEISAEQIGEIVFGTVSKEYWRKATRSLRELVNMDFDARSKIVLEAPGTLAPHPVIDGRSEPEHIEWILTYTGQAFILTEDWAPVMVLGPTAVSVIPWSFNLKDADGWDGPRFSVAGWAQGATRLLNEGRVALLGDGNMCSAGLGDLDSELEGPLIPYGINDPRAPHNAQFCLNIVHWLSGLLDESARKRVVSSKTHGTSVSRMPSTRPGRPITSATAIRRPGKPEPSRPDHQVAPVGYTRTEEQIGSGLKKLHLRCSPTHRPTQAITLEWCPGVTLF